MVALSGNIKTIKKQNKIMLTFVLLVVVFVGGSYLEYSRPYIQNLRNKINF